MYNTTFTPFAGKKTIGTLTCTEGAFSFSATVNLGIQATLVDYKVQLQKAKSNAVATIDLSTVTTFINK